MQGNQKGDPTRALITEKMGKIYKGEGDTPDNKNNQKIL